MDKTGEWSGYGDSVHQMECFCVTGSNGYISFDYAYGYANGNPNLGGRYCYYGVTSGKNGLAET